VCRARKHNVIVHARYEFEALPVEVPSFLGADAALSRVDMREDCALPASLGLVLLPAPFEGEPSLET